MEWNFEYGLLLHFVSPVNLYLKFLFQYFVLTPLRSLRPMAKPDQIDSSKKVEFLL